METDIGYLKILSYFNSNFKIIGVTAFLYVLLACAAKLLFSVQINLLPFLPAMGFAVAVSLIFGRKAIVGVAIGSILYSLLHYSQEILQPIDHQLLHNGLGESLTRLILVVLSAFLISWGTQRLCKTKYPFTEGTHILYFTLVSVLGGIVASSVAILPMVFLSDLSPIELKLLWGTVTRGSILGIVLVTPFVLSFVYKSRLGTQWTLQKRIEVVLLPLITLGVSVYIFETNSHYEAILYFLLLWGGYRFHLRLICLQTLIIAVVSMYYTTHRLGPGAFGIANGGFILLQLYLFVHMISILFFKAIQGEKEEKERGLELSKQILSTERNVLKATIESSDSTSIFSLDRNLDYLSFNSAHQRFMREVHGVAIEVGCNHLDLLKGAHEKDEFLFLYQQVLKGNPYVKEDSDSSGSYWRINKSPIRDDENQIIGVSVIVSDISDLRIKEIQLEEKNYSLNERIKELSCLYDISRVLSQKSISTSEKLRECVNIIQASFRFSESVSCFIEFQQEKFYSANYQKPSLSISEEIVLKGVECGRIEVGCWDMSALGESFCFLEDEKKLLQGVSDIISKSLQTKIAEDNLRVSEENYRTLFENIQDVFFKVSLKDRTVLEVSPSCAQFNGIRPEEIKGQPISLFCSRDSQANAMFERLYKRNRITDFYDKIVIKGKVFHVSINAVFSCDSYGAPEYLIGSLRDMSKRYQAEESLKISEEKFRSIFENMQDIYYRTDLDGKMIEVSPSCEKQLGYTREQMIGKTTEYLYNDPLRQEELREKIIRNGFINDEQVHYITASGELVFFSINCKLLYDCEGQPAFIDGSIRNINERILNQRQLMEADQRIKDSERKLRNIFENMRDVFFVGSIKTDTLLDISPSCSYFGVQPKDLIGKSIQDFYYDPADRKQVLDIRNKYGEIKDYVVRYVFNEKLFYVSLNSKITYDENHEAEFLIGSFTDVSDRVQAEENLKRSEARLRSIYENFDDVHFKTKLDGTIEELSPSFVKHFLIPVSQGVGMSVVDFYNDKNDRHLLLDKILKDGFVSDFECEFKDAENTVQHISMNAHLLYEDGQAVAIEGTLRNVNDRVRVQKEMLAKNRMLEFQNTELEQFAYIASHDLQEPLITVKHCIELLKEELAESLEVDQKQYLEFISSSTSRMQVLVKGLLDYSRIGKERKIGLVDCNEIVDDLLADMESSLKESNARVVYDKLPQVLCNKTELRQIFQNLISNANKFRKSDQTPLIKLSAVEDGKNWLFSVEDNGIGIREEDKDKIFVIFKRLHNRHEYKGTGIGLSHCKKVVEQHRGKIWVESTYNVGSTFKWTLPREVN